MCKWVGLPYSECTWEDSDLIRRLCQHKVDQYQARLKSQRIPSRLSKVCSKRSVELVSIRLQNLKLALFGHATFSSIKATVTLKLFGILRMDLVCIYFGFVFCSVLMFSPTVLLLIVYLRQGATYSYFWVPIWLFVFFI